MAHRIRGRRLQRIRYWHLQREPLCRACAAQGLTTEGVEVDHVVPLSQGGADDASNRQTLCAECHRIKTERDLAIRRNPCDETGEPTDAGHHWNVGGVGRKSFRASAETVRALDFI